MTRTIIIDDERDMISIIQSLLELLDVECIGCETAEDALLQLQDHEIDTIIVDLMLPRMSGLEFCREVRKESKYASLPIVMVTAKDLSVDERKELMLLEVQLFAKPISPSVLLDFVRSSIPVHSRR